MAAENRAQTVDHVVVEERADDSGEESQGVSPIVMSEVIVTLNSPESLLYTSVQSASVSCVCLDLEELRLRFRTARTPRLSKRHVVNWTFFCDSSIPKGWSWGYPTMKAVLPDTNSTTKITRLLILYDIVQHGACI
jgi:hypothetical protein